eukprot:3458638-Amphidinium_carterae.1
MIAVGKTEAFHCTMWLWDNSASQASLCSCGTKPQGLGHATSAKQFARKFVSWPSSTERHRQRGTTQHKETTAWVELIYWRFSNVSGGPPSWHHASGQTQSMDFQDCVLKEKNPEVETLLQ